MIDDSRTDALPPGTILGMKYRIERMLGQGGMGAVYVAYHIDLRKLVALKVIASQHSNDQRTIERFRLEARMASQARHPNIVEVLDLGNADNRWFLAMELLEGLDLFDAIVMKRTYDPVEIVPVLDQVLSALETAHGLGLVHRDLKPENVFLARSLDGDVHVKILDFGVVKVVDEGASAHLTRTGTVVGTPEYMSPEQATDNQVDARSDLYSVGCIAYAMLCGGPPFVDKSVLRVLSAQVTQQPRPPSQLRPGLAHANEVDKFVLRALEKRPAQRFQSAGEMRAALHELGRVLGGPDTVSRRITLPQASEGLDRTHPSGASSADDLARTIPDPGESRAPRVFTPPAPAPAPQTTPSTTGVRAHPTGVSTLGVVLAATIGALVAAVVTYLLVSR